MEATEKTMQNANFKMQNAKCKMKGNNSVVIPDDRREIRNPGPME
jgi:hypothetical protein